MWQENRELLLPHAFSSVSSSSRAHIQGCSEYYRRQRGCGWGWGNPRPQDPCPPHSKCRWDRNRWPHHSSAPSTVPDQFTGLGKQLPFQPKRTLALQGTWHLPLASPSGKPLSSSWVNNIPLLLYYLDPGLPPPGHLSMCF